MKNLLIFYTVVLLTGCGLISTEATTSTEAISKDISSDIDTHELNNRGRVFKSFGLSSRKFKVTNIRTDTSSYSLILEAKNIDGSFTFPEPPKNLLPQMTIPSQNIEAFRSLLQTKLTRNLNEKDPGTQLAIADTRYTLFAYASKNDLRVVSIRAPEGEFNFLEKDVKETIRLLDVIKTENELLY